MWYHVHCLRCACRHFSRKHLAVGSSFSSTILTISSLCDPPPPDLWQFLLAHRRVFRVCAVHVELIFGQHSRTKCVVVFVLCFRPLLCPLFFVDTLVRNANFAKNGLFFSLFFCFFSVDFCDTSAVKPLRRTPSSDLLFFVLAVFGNPYAVKCVFRDSLLSFILWNMHHAQAIRPRIFVVSLVLFFVFFLCSLCAWTFFLIKHMVSIV